MKIVITGVAGFIGYHLARALVLLGHEVVGLDNLDPYYAVQLKRDRLADLARVGPVELVEVDVSDLEAMRALFGRLTDVTHVIHLAAQAGVRHSLLEPAAYVQANVMGPVAVLEACRLLPRLEHVLYASSSSVYGANTKTPFSVADVVTSPVSLYAATKLATEHVSECYAHLYGIRSTGFRFFTVYGPWGRPDMATWLFTEAILAGEPIPLFNHGDMERDFTYVDDVVAGLVAALPRPPAPNAFGAPHRVYNIGNNRPTRLLHFVELLEQAIGRKAQVRMEPMQVGDVRRTFADIEDTRRDFGYEPATPIEVGIPKFVDWYVRYHGAR